MAHPIYLTYVGSCRLVQLHPISFTHIGSCRLIQLAKWRSIIRRPSIFQRFFLNKEKRIFQRTIGDHESNQPKTDNHDADTTADETHYAKGAHPPARPAAPFDGDVGGGSFTVRLSHLKPDECWREGKEVMYKCINLY